MQTTKKALLDLFTELNNRIELLNSERRADGLIGIPKGHVRLLGQMSLLAHDEISAILTLAQTGDLDALLTMEHSVKVELKKLLQPLGLVYDEDSYLIWIPPGTRFEPLLDLDYLLVESIDPESALVSKAIKAPIKNKLLVREAIASEKFPQLVDRILSGGGKLENFV